MHADLVPPEEAVMSDRLGTVRAALVEESRAEAANDERGAVVIAKVEDPAKLLAARGPRLHLDVVDALTDLVVALLDGEDGEDRHAEDSSP